MTLQNYEAITVNQTSNMGLSVCFFSVHCVHDSHHSYPCHTDKQPYFTITFSVGADISHYLLSLIGQHCPFNEL